MTENIDPSITNQTLIDYCSIDGNQSQVKPECGNRKGIGQSVAPNHMKRKMPKMYK